VNRFLLICLAPIDPVQVLFYDIPPGLVLGGKAIRAADLGIPLRSVSGGLHAQRLPSVPSTLTHRTTMWGSAGGWHVPQCRASKRSTQKRVLPQA